jgi:hypothetical protein
VQELETSQGLGDLLPVIPVILERETFPVADQTHPDAGKRFRDRGEEGQESTTTGIVDWGPHRATVQVFHRKVVQTHRNRVQGRPSQTRGPRKWVALQPTGRLHIYILQTQKDQLKELFPRVAAAGRRDLDFY